MALSATRPMQTDGKGLPSLAPSPDTGRIQTAKQDEELRKEVLKMFNTKFEFFGRVVDERGQPISGASTAYIVTANNWNANSTESGPMTDNDGRFSITGRGPQITVWVSHPSYYKTGMERQRITYAGPANASEKPPVNGPVVFVLHSKGQGEPLVHHSLIKTSLPLNGQPVVVDLRKGSVGLGTESIALVLQSTGDKLPLNKYYPFDWNLKIQVQNGGVLERTDRFQFQAPSEGYLAEYTYSMSSSLPMNQWQGRFDNDFFVLLQSGLYARVHVHVVPETGACRIESFLNPQFGSRNLEFDPAHQIKNP